MKSLVFVALMAAGPLAAQQPARVYGVVADSSTGKPLAGAEITLGDEARTTSSGGRFVFGSAPSGILRLRVRALGFTPQDHQLEILPGSDQRIDLHLVPTAIELNSVVIRAESEASMSGAELERRGSTLAAALDGWEGVVVSRTGSGNEAVPQVRGSAPDEVLVLVDGFPANNPFTGRADLARLYSRDVERVSLERGAQTARVGTRAVAGVINIQTRRSGNSGAAIRAGSFGSRESHVSLGGSAGRISLTEEQLSDGFRYDRPAGGEATRENAGGNVYSLNARLSRPVDLTARASLSNRGLPGTVTNPTPGAAAEDRSVFVGVRTGGRTQVGASLEWLSTRASDSDPPPGFVSYDGTTEGLGGSASIAMSHRVAALGWRGDITSRIDARHDAFSGDAVVSGAHFTRGGIGVAAHLERTGRGSTVTIAPAVRVEWWSGRHDPAASVRVDAQWLRGGTEISLGAGSAITAPALADILFREGVGIRLNPNLRPERVRWEFEAGVGQQVTQGRIGASLRARAFWGRVEDLILWTPDFRFVWSPGNFDVLRRGGEVGVDLRLPGDLQLSGSTNFSAVTYDRPGGAQVRYRPRLTHSAFLGWAPGPWRLSAHWHHLGVRYSNNVGTNPLPAVDLISIGLERRLGRILTVSGEVRDLLDQRPSYIAGFPAPGRSYHASLNLEFP